MKLLLTCLAGAIASPAIAQLSMDQHYGFSSQTFNQTVRSYGGFDPSTETPTMRRQKLARALALRDEAGRLAAADGGVLTPIHISYIRKKAHAILGY